MFNWLRYKRIWCKNHFLKIFENLKIRSDFMFLYSLGGYSNVVESRKFGFFFTNFLLMKYQRTVKSRHFYFRKLLPWYLLWYAFLSVIILMKLCNNCCSYTKHSHKYCVLPKSPIAAAWGQKILKIEDDKTIFQWQFRPTINPFMYCLSVYLYQMCYL